MKKKRLIRKWLWYFSFPAAAILLYKYGDFQQLTGLIGTLIGILSPFVGGLILAFFLYRPSAWLENRLLNLNGKAWPKLARPLSLTTVYLALLSILALLVYLVIPVLVNSGADLIGSLSGYVKETRASLDQMFAPGGLLETMGIKATAGDIYNMITKWLMGLLTAQNVEVFLGGMFSIVTSLMNVVLSIIISIYMLSGREHLLASFRNLLGLFVAPRRINTLKGYGSRIATIFYRYFYGAFLDSLLVGVVVSVGLAIFQVPYAFLLGMTVGLMNLIPYFGAIIGGIGVALVTLLTTNIYTALGVAVYIIVVQQIDANIIQPRVVGESVGLRPFYVLLSVTLFGGLLGFWGVLLAPPLMAIVQLFVREFTIRRKRKLAAKAAAESDKPREK